MASVGAAAAAAAAASVQVQHNRWSVAVCSMLNVVVRVPIKVLAALRTHDAR